MRIPAPSHSRIGSLYNQGSGCFKKQNFGTIFPTIQYMHDLILTHVRSSVYMSISSDHPGPPMSRWANYSTTGWRSRSGRRSPYTECPLLIVYRPINFRAGTFLLARNSIWRTRWSFIHELALELYSMMQSDGNTLCGDVLDSFNMANMDLFSILNNIYE